MYGTIRQRPRHWGVNVRSWRRSWERWTVLQVSLEENTEMLEMAIEEQDEEIVESVVSEVNTIEQEVHRLEFQRMFRGEVDRQPLLSRDPVGLRWHRGPGLG